MSSSSSPSFDTPAELRGAIRAGQFTGPTAGLLLDYVQTNLVIVPQCAADDFEEFCRRNAKACPLMLRTAPGDPVPTELAADADLRTDVPRYRVFRHGVAEAEEPTDIRDLWRDDLVSFLLGCSFTFEQALEMAGLELRHHQQGCNVPMYRTNVMCEPSGPFHGPLVVSMRPFPYDHVQRAVRITAQYPLMHGSPVFAGDPTKIGIADLSRPDFGDPVAVHEGEMPVFWACGVTPQLALAAAKLDLAITHSPGRMFVTDVPGTHFCEPG